jgi:hypothetical protein
LYAIDSIDLASAFCVVDLASAIFPWTTALDTVSLYASNAAVLSSAVLSSAVLSSAVLSSAEIL